MSNAPPNVDGLARLLGGTDIYVLDQILRGRIGAGMRILDAGCGEGRNIRYLVNAGCDVHGIDRTPEAIAGVRAVAAVRLPDAADRFRLGTVESMPWPDGEFDVVLCNAVLHFANSTEHFNAMVSEMARVLARGGLFFARLMTTIGMEGRLADLGDNRYRLPGGLEAFLADEGMLDTHTRDAFRGVLADPLKSTLVERERSMTTWVVRKLG